MSKVEPKRVDEVPATTGIPKHWENPIKPERFEGKHQSDLAKQTGVIQFGVNQVTLEPGAWSSLRHWHEGEDEFVYVLEGKLTLVNENGEHEMKSGAFVGFAAGVPNAHHLVNYSAESTTFLVVGSCKPGEDVCHYPDEELGPIKR